MNNARRIININGDDTFRFEGVDYSQADIDQMNIGLRQGGVAEIRIVPSTPDQQANDLRQQYTDSLIAKYIDDDYSFNNIENEVEELVQQKLNPQKRVTKSTVQNASPNTPQKLTLGKPREMQSHQLSNLLRPWSGLTRQANSDDYIGYTEEQWLRNNQVTYEKLGRLKAGGATDAELDQYLREYRGFGNAREREKVIEAHGDPYFQGKLRTEFYAVPNAAADEALSMAVLSESGFSPVQAGNAQTLTGTDITAFAGKTPLKVDAQTRTGARTKSNSAGLNLAVVKNGGFIRELMEEQDSTSLLGLIGNNARSHRSMSPDKLMHTSQVKWNPLTGGEDFDKELQKDLIISSDRPGLSQRGLQRGPFNREKPEGWRMIDMELARRSLLTKSLIELNAMGVEPRNYGGNLSLNIPPEIMDKLSNKDIPLAQKAMRRLSSTPRW